MNTARYIFGAAVVLAICSGTYGEVSPDQAQRGDATGTRGVLCLTFDDRNFDAWERCIPLFEKYDAHATFFVYGQMDDRALSVMRRLSNAGHSIGLHGLRHQKATDLLAKLGAEGYLREEILPQLSVCRAKGMSVRSFAYPMSVHTPATDKLLLGYFDRLRSGFGIRGDGSTWGEVVEPVPVSEIASRRVLIGMCGTNLSDSPARVASMLPSVAASNLVLTVYAHSIEAPGEKHDSHNIAESDLETLLSAAKSAGVAVVGFDELPCLSRTEPLAEAPFSFSRQRLFPGFDGNLCKVQPSIATDGKGVAILGFQKLLLSGSDVFYGQFLSKSVDGGRTWSEPVEQTALADTHENGLRVARYATVRYAFRRAKWYAIGMAQLYKGDKKPFQKYVDGRPYGTPIFVSLDAEKGAFTGYRTLPFPFEYEMALPFGQALECENGDVIMPFYFRPIGAGKKSQCVTVRYAFDGDGMKVVEVGTPVKCDSLARGMGEPSLARLGGKVYMTVRSDEAGMWCESGDGGLSFSEPRAWTWTDGRRIGNKNTQQHWLSCGGGLFLAYTREDRTNGHVFRNRAPIFSARFDPVCGGLVRDSEMPIVPELGARLGNFCVANDGASGSWLVTAEWMQPKGCERYGSDNSLWLVKTRGGGQDMSDVGMLGQKGQSRMLLT